MTHTWIQDGTAAVSFVGVTAFNTVYGFNDTTGDYLEDDSGLSEGGQFTPPTGRWTSQTFGGCLTSMAQTYYFSGAFRQLIGAGCTPDGNGDEGLFSNQGPNGPPVWSQLPSAGTQTAVFQSGLLFGLDSLWSIDAEGFVSTYDPVTNTWVQTLGASVTAITNHYLVGGDQTIWEWNDNAPNGVSGQVVNGNWQGPVMNGVPSGAAIHQLAFASETLSESLNPLGGPSALWAIDVLGNVYYAFDAFTPR